MMKMDFLGICDSDNWDDSGDAKELHKQLFNPQVQPCVKKKIKGDRKTKVAEKKKAAEKNVERIKSNQPLDVSQQVSSTKEKAVVLQKSTSDIETSPEHKEKINKNKKRRKKTESGQPAKRLKVQLSSDNLTEEGELRMKTGSLENEKNGRQTEKQKQKKQRKRKPRNNKFKTPEFGYTSEKSKTENSDANSKISPPVLTSKSSEGAELNTTVCKVTVAVAKKQASKEQHLKNQTFTKKNGLGPQPRTKKMQSKVEQMNVGLNSSKQNVTNRNSKKVNENAVDRTKFSDKLKMVSDARIACGGSNKTPAALATKHGRLATESAMTENNKSAIEANKQSHRTFEEDDEPVDNTEAKQAFKSKMEARLKSAHFRYLNEQLYKTTGTEAQQMMLKDQEAFNIYHQGFAQQVSQWPINPVDKFIEELKTRPLSLTVGDFGCGDARIAQSVKQTVHSFDFCPLNEHVTVCNMEKVPLKSNSLDIAIFCLSLMGTNWINYIKEANRVLKLQGELMVAEVASRFASVPDFIKIMKHLGFKRDSKDFSNKMFLMFHFTKVASPKSVELEKGEVLKPCLYKRR